MFKILKVLLFISALLALVFFLNESSPSIAIEVADKKIHTTLFIFCLVLLILIVIIYIMIKALYSIISLPFVIKKNYQNKLNESKFLSLVDLCIAKEQMDNNLFQRALSFLVAADMPKYVKTWLNYQQRSSHDTQELETLLQHPETANLAIMQLIRTEIALGKTQSALNHLRNLPISISNTWKCVMIIKVCFKENAWDKLLQFLTQEKHNIPNKEYLVDICHYKIAKEIYDSRIAFDKLKEAILILNKVKSPFPPVAYLKSLLLIKLNEHDAVVKFINKNWEQFSDLLIYPILLLLRNLDQKSQHKILEKVITNNNLTANIILIIYKAIISSNTDTTIKLLNQYRYQIDEQYICFFEHYYKNIKQEKILLELFTENLYNMIGTANYYYDFEWANSNIEQELVATIPSLNTQKLPAAFTKEST